MKIDIPELDLFLLLSAAMRYSIGRQSYITGACHDWLIKYAPRLSSTHLNQITYELETEIALAERDGRTLGMDMDHEIWVTTLQELKRYLK